MPKRVVGKKIKAISFRQNMDVDYEHKFMAQSTSKNRKAITNSNRVMGTDITAIFDKFVNRMIACSDNFMIQKKKEYMSSANPESIK